MSIFAKVILIMAALSPMSAASQVCVEHISVPKFPPIARAAQVSGIVDLTIALGPKGEVLNVVAKGQPMLVEPTKENIKEWLFCAPNGNEASLRLRYEYWLEGTPVYEYRRRLTPKILIDLGEATVRITAPPPLTEP